MSRHDPFAGGFDGYEDVLGETMDGQEGVMDQRLRVLVGHVAPMIAPPYSFERVVMRARRRRQRRIMMTATAAVLGLAVASGGVLLGFRATGDTVQTAGCGGSTTMLGDVALSGHPAAAAPAGWVRGAPMQRRYEWAIGGVLTASALAGGIFAGCATATNGKQNTATNGATSTPTPVQSNSRVILPPPSSTSTGSASPSPSHSANGLPRCHTADLSPAVSLVADPSGDKMMNLTLTNTSGHTCTIFGYPGLMLQDQNGAGQATTVSRDPVAPAKTVVVPNGGAASSTITFINVAAAAGEPTTGNCEPLSYGLLITPPDEATQLTAQITGGPVAVCQHGTLFPQPFVSGTTGAKS